ncbi:DUF2069 domain-containing protein [Iodobacter fluviatilis]|uniref:DUF2069 domain-containing protein n=1 Tax=Iodobacter fluviatilis TaxID=537 RepID=A0A7G3G9C1_9NEIS|nr:DUF2069 domain-containing protein [Iodobacter fluviatilis]QBC43891.1 DUF2069 domain-containing protein [Iodobacter fluviatilis]
MKDQRLITLSHWLSVASLVALIALCISWELWLAPMKEGGSWLALKGVLLLPMLMGVLKGRRYTYQWGSMYILLWFVEGVMRAWGDHGLSQILAGAEVALASLCFASFVAFAWYTRPSLGKPVQA